MSFSIAVFPYLKTSARFRLGGLEFRSTEDLEGLPDEQREAVRDIADMLFAKDDLRIASATFAIAPEIDIDRQGATVDLLADIRAVVAYAYSAPHDVFDDILLSPADVTLVVLYPREVSAYLVYPNHHTIPVQGSLERRVAADEREMLPGYAGLYNFSEPLWVARGSRLYPPKPQPTLNIQQDMATNFSSLHRDRAGMRDLLRLLESPQHPARTRAFTALRWYNHANESSAGADRALLSLAVAFEALFELPDNAKSDRLADSISLVLGRTARIHDWATQFYAARSRVAHEGAARELYYRPAGGQKAGSDDQFGSLMLTGRHIFQLCMWTLLFGMALADEARLGDKLVSNAERFGRLCSILEQPADPAGALVAIDPIVQQIERHRFVQSSPVDFDLMLGALRRASSALLACDPALTDGLGNALRLCAAAKQGRDLFTQLGALRDLVEAFKGREKSELPDRQRVVHVLAEEIWSMTFMTYFALERERKASPVE